MTKIISTFLAIFCILLFVFEIEVKNYLLTVEYDGKIDKIYMTENPSSLKKKCDMGVMYLQPWRKEFSETPKEPGYWKVKITNIETIVKEKDRATNIYVSLVISFLIMALFFMLGFFDPKRE